MSILVDFVLEHRLHGWTIVSTVLAMIGFFYLAYDLLDRPHGPLRWLLQVIVPGLIVALPLSLFVVIPFVLPASSNQAYIDWEGIAITLAVYGGLIGTFNGLFAESSKTTTFQHMSDERESNVAKQLPLPLMADDSLEVLATLHSEHASQLEQLPLFEELPAPPKKAPGFWRMLLRDGLIGFLFASCYWFVEVFLIRGSIFRYPFYGVDIYDRFISDYIGFAVVGMVGGSLWRFIHQPDSVSTDKPRLFSLRDCLLGLMFWSLICMTMYFIATLLFAEIWGIYPLQVSDALVLGTSLLILAGGLASGFSRFVFWMVHHIPPASSDKLSSVFPMTLKDGFIGSLWRIISWATKRPMQRPPLASLRKDLSRLIFGFLAWLIILLGILIIAPLAFALLIDLAHHRGLDYSSVYPISMDFLKAVLIGTGVTVLVGYVTVVVLRFIIWMMARHRANFLGKSSPISQITSERGVVGSAGQLATTSSTGAGSYLFSLLIHGLIMLAYWYEIWFVFGVIITVRFLLQGAGLSFRRTHRNGPDTPE